MPLYRANLLSGQQYTGATAATGLFQPTPPGSIAVQVRLNSIRFHTSVSVAFTYATVDPSDSTNAVVIYTATGVDLSDDNARLLVTDSASMSWALRFTSGVLGADAWLTIDYDFMPTEG